ncbi:MAG: hypothetical protein AAF602_15890 [Myxococcota bacterium]
MFAWLFTSEALALSCIWGIYDISIWDAQSVPPDVVIVASHTYGELETEPVIQVVDAAGEEVSVDVRWEPFVIEVTPREPLPPGTYTMIGQEPEDLGDFVDLSFTVEDLPEGPELAAPSIRRARRETSRNEWGTSRGIDLTWSAVEEASIYEVELARDADFADAGRAVATGEGRFLGDGLCGSTVPDYDHDVEHFVRVRAVDVDGDASAWSAVERVRPGGFSPIAVGCATRSGAPLGSLTLALAGVIGLRRRRSAAITR